MTTKFIPVPERRLLLDRAWRLEWEIDRLNGYLSALEKEHHEIIEHCLRKGLTAAAGFRLVRRQGVACDGPEAYRVECIGRE